MANNPAINPQAQELAQLRDIHMPEAIGWWPLAPGWYLLVLLIIAVLAAITIFAVRHYKNGHFKRQALRLLETYHQQYQQESNSQVYAARVSELLKRVALVYFPRSKVASLQGDAWIEFLNQTAKGLHFESLRVELLEAPYQPLIKQDLTLLFEMTRSWIKQRRGPCLR